MESAGGVCAALFLRYNKIMRTVLFWFLILSCSVVCRAETIRKEVPLPDGTGKTVAYFTGGKFSAQEVINNDGAILEKTGEIPDGLIREYWNSGQPKADYTYKKEKLDGLTRLYDESGKISVEILYKEGKRDGLVKEYYRNGIIKAKKMYRDDLLEGAAYDYDPNGKLVYEKNYKNGKLEGSVKQYADNEMVTAEFTYVGGQLDGVSKVYYGDGEIKYIDTYKQGQKLNRRGYDSRGKEDFNQDYPVNTPDESR